MLGDIGSPCSPTGGNGRAGRPVDGTADIAIVWLDRLPDLYFHAACGVTLTVLRRQFNVGPGHRNAATRPTVRTGTCGAPTGLRVGHPGRGFGRTLLMHWLTRILTTTTLAVTTCMGLLLGMVVPGLLVDGDGGADAAGHRVWYVSPSGSDSRSGTRAAPLRTVDAAISKAGQGDSIYLRRGRYHQSITVSKPGLTIRNRPGERVTLDGSSRVTGWQRDGSRWVRTGWRTQFDHSPTYTFGAADNRSSGWGFVNAAYPMAAWPDQVWVNGGRMRQVSSPSRVSRGTFAVDYANDRLYLGTNPRGRTVRASTLAKAISVRASGTRLVGLRVRRYAPSVPHMGAITLERPGARLSYMTISGMATTGLSAIADDARLYHVQVTRSGMLGIHASGAYGLRLNRVAVRYNNVEHFNSAPAAGGMKVHRSRNVSVRSSVFLGNRGTGLWFDVSNYNMRLVNNRILNNSGHGIFLEISERAVVADNLIRGNDGSGVLVDNTGHVRIWNNTVMGTGRPINVVQDSRRASAMSFPGYDYRRPTPDPTVPWVTRVIRVSNNVISGPTSAANCLLCVEDYTHARSAAQMDVLANGNAYRRRSRGAPAWVVVWSAGRGDPRVYTSLADFRRSSRQEARGRLVLAPVVTSRGGPTTLLRRITPDVARPLPASIASLVGRPAGSRHLGVWH